LEELVSGLLRPKLFPFGKLSKAKPAAQHCKKRFAIFPSPAGMSITELSLAGNNLIIPVPV
jgi:hypothetical protein